MAEQRKDTKTKINNPKSLCDACRRGEVHRVIEFIYKEKSSAPSSGRLISVVDTRDPSGNFPLHLAAESGHNEVVSVLLDHDANVHVVNANGDTPLHVAASSGCLEVIRSLLGAGADVTAGNFKKKTPLHLASTNGHLELVKFFTMETKAEINARAKDGTTPLYCAYTRFHRDIIKVLIERGGQSDVISRLHMYSLLGNTAKVIEMILRGADVNIRDGNGRTPMHVASFMGFPDVVEELAKVGAFLNVKDTDEMTPFLYACKNGNLLAANILLERGADHKIPQRDGKSGLHLVAMLGHTDMLEAMLGIVAGIGGAKGRDRLLSVEWRKKSHSQRNSDEKNGKHTVKRRSILESWSSSKSDLEMEKHQSSSTQQLYKDNKSSRFQKFKERFKKPKEKQHETSESVSSLGAMFEFLEKKDTDGRTPLLLACAGGHAAIAATLLDVGAQTDVFDKDGDSCIHIACRNNFTDIAVNILQSGVNINTKNNKGETPLHACVRSGNHALANMLLNHRANVDAADMNSQTPLHLACKLGQVIIAKILIFVGARLTVRDQEDMTALHVACLHRQSQIVGVLLENSASAHVSDGYRNSPLHYACRSGDFDSVRILMQQERVSVNAFGEFGTPLYEACANGHLKLVLYLLEKGANVKAYGKTGTPLHGACAGDHCDVVELLLQHNVNVNATNRENDTPLHIATRRAVFSDDSCRSVSDLLRNGASLDTKNSLGRKAMAEVFHEVKEFSRKEMYDKQNAKVRPESVLVCKVKEDIRFYTEKDERLFRLLDCFLSYHSPLPDLLFEDWNINDFESNRILVLYFIIAIATLKFRNVFPPKILEFLARIERFDVIQQLVLHTGIRLRSDVIEDSLAYCSDIYPDRTYSNTYQNDVISDLRISSACPLPLKSIGVAYIRRHVCKARRWISRDLITSSHLPVEAKRLLLLDKLFLFSGSAEARPDAKYGV